ncbi:MAG: C1 family peptidase [Candidatus Hydrogenedentota bacterium]
MPEELAAKGTPAATHPVMRISPEAWEAAVRAVPTLPVPSRKADLPGSVDLLPYFDYVAVEHDQGVCGNCWVWASMGAVQMALSTQFGVRDRLSFQHYTSCYDEGFACHGGLANWFAAYVNRLGYVIPWSNLNADYQQYDPEDYENERPAVPCHDVETAPRYLLQSCSTYRVPTFEYSEKGLTSDNPAAVAAIKGQLHAGNAVVLAYYMPNEDSLHAMFSFWEDYGEDTYLDVSAWNGRTWDPDHAGGHAVLIVGYTEEAWIILNSWGTMEGGRPNGLMAFGPKDEMNYAASYTHEGEQSSVMNFFVHHVGYNGLDSDGDMVSDAAEERAGTDPFDSTDTPEMPLPWIGAALGLMLAAVHALRRRRTG